MKEVLEVAKAEARKETEAELEVERQRRMDAENVIRAQRARIAQLSGFVGKAASVSVFILGFAALVGATVVTSPLLETKVSVAVARTVLSACLLAATLLGLWNVVSGGTLRKLARVVEVGVAGKAATVLTVMARLPLK